MDQGLSKFELNNYFSMRGYKDNSRNLSISAFNGFCTLDIWDRQHQGGPVDKEILTRELVSLLISTMEKLVQAQPNTRIPITTYTYVRNSAGGQVPSGGKYEKHITFTFTKDEKQMYGLEIQSDKIINPLKCLFKAPPIMVDTDDLNDAARSTLQLKAFIDFLNKELPMMRVASRFNMVKPARKPNNSGSTGGTPNYTNDDVPY